VFWILPILTRAAGIKCRRWAKAPNLINGAKGMSGVAELGAARFVARA